MRNNINPKKNNIISDKAVSIEHIKHLIETTDHPGNFGDSVRPACVFLLFSQREELYVTVILKADNKGYPWANQIALPGGHIDPNETPVETVFRELKEELNISSPHVDLIGSMGHFMTINNIQIQVFAGVWNEKEKIQFDKKEIAKVFTLPFTDFIQTHFDNSFNGRIPGWDELIYPVEDAMMWGATAKIMHYLIELIYTN